MSKIVCGGYGGNHGFARGRLWFVCSKCRWNPGYSDASEKLRQEKAKQDAAYKALHETGAKA